MSFIWVGFTWRVSYKGRVFNDAVDVGTERAGTVATVYGPCMWTFQRRAAVKIGLG